ncbi:MAG: hypothetical protein J6386_14070 [Candidatus Synoicihabitans palmerolidicus]|nr:hypothetical protein [Candidatus Synoicihabitans palmerolidicus]
MEENLGASTGHFLNAISGLVGEFPNQGCFVTVVANRLWKGTIARAEVLPFLPESFPDRFPRAHSGVTRLRAAAIHNLVLTERLFRLLWRQPPRDLVIATNINIFHAVGWYTIWLMFGGWNIRRLVLNFGGPTWIENHDAEGQVIHHHAARWVTWIYKRFRRGVRSGRILATAESDHDAQIYTRLTGFPFTGVLAPRDSTITSAALAEKAKPRSPHSPFVFSWIGRNSAEKGFGWFIDALASSCNATPTITAACAFRG